MDVLEKIFKTIGEAQAENDMGIAMKQIADTLGELAEASEDKLRKVAYSEAQLAVLKKAAEHLKTRNEIVKALDI